MNHMKEIIEKKFKILHRTNIYTVLSRKYYNLYFLRLIK